MLGVLRYMARLADMTRERTMAQPKIFPLLPALTCASVRLFSFIQAFPKRAGEYQTPPRTKAEMPATATAIQLGVIKMGVLCLGDRVFGFSRFEYIGYFSSGPGKGIETGKNGDG